MRSQALGQRLHMLSAEFSIVFLTCSLAGVAQYIEGIESVELVFYSEGGQYWNVFSPVIDALHARGVKCAYLTSDDNDKGLQYVSPHVIVKYIGGTAMSAAVLNHLDVQLVVMTSPQLGIFSLRRSQNVQHYSHLIHAPTDALM